MKKIGDKQLELNVKYSVVGTRLSGMTISTPHVRELDAIRQRYTEWQRRFDVYANHKRMLDWQQSRKFKHQFNKFKLTVEALKELEIKNDVIQNADEIRSLVLATLENEMSRLENNLAREEERILGIKIIDKKKIAEFNLQRKELIKRKDESSAAKKQLIGKSAPNLYKLLNKTGIRFNKHFHRADLVADATKTGSALNDIGTTIAKMFIPIGQAITNALTAIPIVTSIVGAIPIVINAFKAFTQDKGIGKKAIAVTGLILGAAALSIAIATAIVSLGLISGIAAAGLLLIGTTVKYIAPFVNIIVKLVNKNADLAFFQHRDYDKITFDTTNKLDRREKALLLHAVEEIWATQKTDGSKAELAQALHCIQHGEVNNEFSQNKLIKSALNTHSINAFLKAKAPERINELKADIQELRARAKSKFVQSTLGLFAVAGGLMMCFPPTLVAGAAVLLATAIVTVIIKYNILEKIGNFIGGLIHRFSSKSGAGTDESTHHWKKGSTNALNKELHAEPLISTHRRSMPESHEAGALVSAKPSMHGANMPREEGSGDAKKNVPTHH